MMLMIMLQMVNHLSTSECTRTCTTTATRSRSRWKSTSMTRPITNTTFKHRSHYSSQIFYSNFSKSLDLSSINCEVELDLKWSRNCVLTEYDDYIMGVSFVITSSKLYVLVVTFSINNNINF